MRAMRNEFNALKRKSKVINLAEARSVALLYKVDDEKKYNIIKNYVKHLKEEEGIKKIIAIGYVPAKIIPDYLKPRLEFEFFCNKDLTWKGKPRGNFINNFKYDDYDILIDLESEEIIPLRYLLNWSKAKFKVGFYDKEFECYYDLMIHIPNKDLSDFISQTNYYLSIMNKAI
jgi:hypothetical protein